VRHRRGPGRGREGTVEALAVIAILAFAATASADWNHGDPAKWVQLPDIQETGIDVNATEPHILADDFLCTEHGPITTIKFSAPVGGGHVTLEVIDVAGRVVRTLVDGYRGEGEHGATWNGRDEAGREVASGVYFCRLTAPDTELTRKMLLLK
jgi:hypothetical protein